MVGCIEHRRNVGLIRMKPKKKETAVNIWPSFETADLNSYEPIGTLAREQKIIQLLDAILAELKQGNGRQS